MMDYVPALISMVGGVLAFFFAKSGERNKVGGIGWIMAALLVGGGVLGLYVLREKDRAAMEASLIAEQEADKAAVAAAKQSALVMTLVGNFDLKQTIPSMNLLFEYPYDDEGNPMIPAGFSGPLPQLPEKVVGYLDLSIGDTFYSASFSNDGSGRIALREQDGETVSIFTNDGVETQGGNEEEDAPWGAGPEPAPFGFTYSRTLPVNTQLRRLLYGIVAQESLGTLRFRKGALDEKALGDIEEGLAANPPMLAFYIPEVEGGEQCDSYVHAPLRFVRLKDGLIIEDVAYDAFELKLTPNGFAPDPCNNNPF